MQQSIMSWRWFIFHAGRFTWPVIRLLIVAVVCSASGVGGRNGDH